MTESNERTTALRIARELDAYGKGFSDGRGVFGEAANLLRRLVDEETAWIHSFQPGTRAAASQAQPAPADQIEHPAMEAIYAQGDMASAFNGRTLVVSIDTVIAALARPSEPAPISDEVEYEVVLTLADGESTMVAASTCGEGTLAEALNYARQYEDEGPVQVFEVRRRPIGGPLAEKGKP